MSKLEFLQAAEEAARVAGQILRDWSEKFTVSEKGPADLVTEADVAAQTAIYEILHRRFPEHGFLGEEGLRQPAGASGYRWIIDPLDGTSNYVHRFPYYAVSIGLQQHHEILAGVIYDPTRDELFAAVRGQGATLNGRPIRASRFDRLDRAMVIASFPPGVTADSLPIRRFLDVLPHAQTIHRSGSSALNLAYVGAGRLDAYWSTSLKPWDMAAGVLIAAEAGGRVSRMNGAPLDIDVPDLLCTNGTAIHEQLSGLLCDSARNSQV
ncbi:MAG TPA: inositol monophosphatase family protein [Planctomycetaceae bacterium]|nr:inositol monophosphatase family protein [Planctomycetaceae bacterium]